MAILQFLFNIQADVFVHGTVMAGDQISEEGAQFLNNGFRHLSGVGEDEGCGMGADQICNGFDVVFEQFSHREVAELRMRDENVKVELLEPEIFAMDTDVGWPLASRSSLLTRYSATVSSGSIVAEIPMRCTGFLSSESSSERVSDR